MLSRLDNLGSKKKVVVIVVISVLAIAIITVGTIFSIKFISHISEVNEVKSALNKVPDIMSNYKAKTGAYPAEFPDVLKLSTKNVLISGNSSFDGTSYCFVGKNSVDKNIVYHISSNSSLVQSGDCSNGANIAAPSMPSGLAVAFANQNDVKIIWDKSTEASGYILQCASDIKFNNVVFSLKTTNESGTCSNLSANTQYFYRVAATNSAGTSVWSSVKEVTTNS